MRCAYCHNPEIVRGRGRQDIAGILAFLEKRRGLLDGIVLSGGEACVYPGLPHFIRSARDMGFQTKLDTNGLKPDVVRNFLDNGLLDYIALDYKAPPEKFKKVTGMKKFNDFRATLSLLCRQDAVPFEVRTTVHTDLLNERDIAAIIADLETADYKGAYYVQNYRADNDRPTLGALPAQRRVLDTRSLPKPASFSMCFRNF